MDKILVDKRVLSATLKTVLKLQKQVAELLEKPEYNKDWLTVNEIKQEYNISEKVFRAYRAKGLKVTQKVPNGKRLIKKTDIEKFLLKKQ